MRRQTAPSLYPDSAYDANLCLKPPPLLWVVILFLSREFTLPFVMGAAQFAGVGGPAIAAMRSFWRLDLTVVPSLLAATVLILIFRRTPKAGRVVRWLWSHGASLLASAAISDFLIAAVGLVRGGGLHDDTFLQAVGAAVDLGCLLYVWFSSRAKDAFADFPTAA